MAISPMGDKIFFFVKMDITTIVVQIVIHLLTALLYFLRKKFKNVVPEACQEGVEVQQVHPADSSVSVRSRRANVSQVDGTSPHGPVQ